MREHGTRDGVRRLFRLPLTSRARTRADADDELAAFMNARITDLVTRGASEEDARAEALRRLGGSTGSTFTEVRHRLRASAARREHRMRIREVTETIAQDLRFGARQLARARGVTTIAVLTLGLGIGANSAIFAVVHAVLLRTLPVERPEELVAVGRTTAIDGHTTGAPRGDLLSLPMYQDLTRDQRLVSGLAASGAAHRLNVRFGHGEGTDEHPNGRFVSANFFGVLGVSAERGRTIGAEDDGAPGAAPVAVISDAYWRSRFGAASDIVGRGIRINGALLTVVGVAQRGFDGDVVERPTQIWLPISMQPLIQPHSASIMDRGTSWLLLLGRLEPGVTLAKARAGFTTMIHASLVAHAGSAGEAAHLAKVPVVVSSGAQGFSAARVKFRAALVALQIGVALVLLIVCTNLANLLVSRALARRTEMGIRLALGAGRRRLVRQMMTESILIVFLGMTAGVAFARWGSVTLARVATTSDSPVAIATGVDATVLLFTAGVSVLAVLVFGFAPALRASRVDLASAMRASSRSIHSAGRVGRVPVGAVLVPVQVMLCLVVVTGTALLTRSLRNIESEAPGLDRDHLLLAEVDVSLRGFTGDRFMALARDVSAAIAVVPGVEAVTYSQNGLFMSRDADAIVAVPGFVGRTADDSLLTYDLVGAGYLHAIGAHLLRGRDLNDRDVSRSPSVAVLNESAARFYFGTVDAVGRVMYFDTGVPTTIVGVARDIRDHSLTAAVDRRAYAPYAQQIAGEDHPALSFEIRTAGDPATMVIPIRRAIAAADPELPQTDVSLVTTLMRDTIRDQRLLATIGTAFGAVALFLCLVGLYGVMTYAVTRRTGEIGLRGALGADRASVLRLVLGDGLRLAVFGLMAGIPLSFAAGRALRTQLYGVPATDVVSFAMAVGSVVVCALLAAFVPAARATSVSPAAALAARE